MAKKREHMAKSLIPARMRAGNRIPGQVPSRDRIDALRLAQQKPIRFNPAMLLNQSGAYLSVDSVLDGLGLSQADEKEWRQFLKKAMSGPNELVVRQDIMAKMLADRIDPALRKAIFQRSMSMYRDTLKKSRVAVVTVDELKKSMEEPEARFYLRSDLHKADPKGGKYYRRTMTKSGKHRYFYDEDSYKRSKDAHVNGEDAAHSAIRKAVGARIQNNEGKGLKLKDLGDLVKRYGKQAVSKALKAECGAEGGLMFKKGCLTSRSKK